MIRNICYAVLLSLLLAGCADDNTNQPEPIPVAGGSVKGPLVNASANLFLVDLTATDLKGELVSSGITDETAALQDITIPGSSTDTFLLEFTAEDDTVDLTSGAAPILNVYQTLVSADNIRSGQVFATPVTTLVLSLARLSGPFDSMQTLNEVVDLRAREVNSTLGFGLALDTNPFTSNPLLTSDDTTDERQASVLAYRLAIEGMAAIFELLAAEISAVNPASNITVDDVLLAVSLDLSDGAIDGLSLDGPVEILAAIADISAVVRTDPAMLLIPGTNTPITRIADVVVSETTTTGVTVGTDAIETGAVSVTPVSARAQSDVDDDGVPDRDDAFPQDAGETVDTDGDGTGNNADTDDDGDGALDVDDVFPLNAEESLDTDSDGIGNNADLDDDEDGTPDETDAFPLDASETEDLDGDGIGNNADTDDDGDGADDTSDQFPLDSSEQVDTDGDGIGNNADTDDDGDGVADEDDNLPLDGRGSLATSATIGSAGGTLTSPDGLMTLTFPANAIAEDTLISIGMASTAATAEFDAEDFPVDSHYLLAPSGTQFAEPVTMTWTIAPENSRPGSLRLVYSFSNNVATAPEEPVVTNPNTGTVTASIQHFSDLFIVVVGGVMGINQPSATVGNQLTWTYNFDLQDNDYTGFIRTEGAVLFDDSGVAGITRQPELLSGDTVISSPQHDQAVHCEFSHAVNSDDDISYSCAPSTTGTIQATCLDGSEEGLSARIGFNFEFEADHFSLLFPWARGLLRVEANGTCRTSVEITEPAFISIGNDVDRITEAPESLVIAECDAQSQPYNVVVSNTRTSIVNASGTCSRDLDFAANSNAIFGALMVIAENIPRLFVYGESGVFITEPVDDVFGELSDFTSTTTDAQHRVNDDGSQIDSQAYTVANNGLVRLRTLNPDGTNTSETAFSAFGLTGQAFIGYAPLTSTTGVGITSSDSSTAYYVDHDANTATEIGAVGDTALGISCTRLACGTGGSCDIDNSETVACVASAYGSEELYPIFSNDILANAPTLNMTVPLPGIKTASPYVTSNAQGQMVVASVNDNEVGKVQLNILDTDGVIIQSAEFFLSDFTDTIGFLGTGASIVLIDPSPEFPNGAVRIAVDDPNGSGDGILTIPVSETLLGTSPEPFFGPAYMDDPL